MLLAILRKNQFYRVLSNFILVFWLLQFPAQSNAQLIDNNELDLNHKYARFEAAFDPVTARPQEEVRIVITAEIDKGWHIYSLIPGEDSPIPPTSINWSPSPLIQKGPAYETNPIVQYDKVIEAILGYHENSAKFYQNFRVPDTMQEGSFTMNGSIRFQVCNERICQLPKTEALNVSYNIENLPQRQEYTFMNRAIDEVPGSGWSLPSVDSLDSALSQGMLAFLLLAVVMGMVAWLTPCVFPMIPITVTFFSKQAEANKRRLLTLAAVFCLGIVVTYTGFGLLITAIIGVSGVANLASNPWINLAIAALFTLFAFSLMGLFELRLPFGLVQKVDQLSRSKGSYLGATLMGTAFTLTAFTCTVQFVGTLLVASSQGEWLWPAIGMLVFSFVFALPFLLLALFPRWVQAFKNKSGTWMIKLKFILGLLELMAVTKFLSNADLVWGLGYLNREAVLLIWTFLLLAVFLIILGIIRIKHVPKAKIKPKHWIPAALSLGLALYLGQGVLGKDLDGWTESYLPPRIQSQQSAKVAEDEIIWHDSLEQGLALAKQENKPVFIDFTGYTCINCRWMEKNTFPDPKVHQRFKDNFITVRLYTDGGKDQERNQKLQIERFKTIALPYYVILSKNNELLATTSGISIPRSFIRFLDRG